jgi:hypothetical protein
MVRVWSVPGDQGARVEIERIQSGARTVLHGLDAESLVDSLDPAAGHAPVLESEAGDRDRLSTEGR